MIIPIFIKFRNQIRPILGLLMVCSFLLFISCVSANKMMKRNKVIISDFSENNLNGVYHNKTDLVDSGSLWDLLYSSLYFKSDKTKIDSDTKVELKFRSNIILEVNLISNDSVVNSLKLRGKIEKGYFSVDKKVFLVPVPFFFFYRENKILLANNSAGGLLLIKDYIDYGWFIIIFGDSGDTSNYEFKKVK
jgi:hypothetical protein